MTENISVPEQPNAKTDAFLDKFTSKMVKYYQNQWKAAHSLIQKYGSRNLSQSPFNSNELAKNLEDARNKISETEERAAIVKKLKGAVVGMLSTQTEIPLPNFLIIELSTTDEKDIEKVIFETFDAEDNKLEGPAIGTAKTGYIATVFSGGQIALKADFGREEEGKIIPSVEHTKATLIPTQLIKR